MTTIREVELRVLNTRTGHVTNLPPSGLGSAHHIYRPALLITADDNNDGSFRLLVMDSLNRAKVLSSHHGNWRDVRLLEEPLRRSWNLVSALEDPCLAPAAPFTGSARDASKSRRFATWTATIWSSPWTCTRTATRHGPWRSTCRLAAFAA